MNKKTGVIALLAVVTFFMISFTGNEAPASYASEYYKTIHQLKEEETELVQYISNSDLQDTAVVQQIAARINKARTRMKHADFWLRYLEPVSYKQINGPLPVEWETEVFEKFEKPYRREGAGFTLAALYLEEEHRTKDSLIQLIQYAGAATAVYTQDSITRNIKDYHHFFLCNRLFLLNLASIYTTGFECPDTSRIIPELRDMLRDVSGIYEAFNESFPTQALNATYLSLYQDALAFVNRQPAVYSAFDHFTFIKNYVNPLYRLNQEMIRQYKVFSRSMVDYSLSKTAVSIFDKSLYNGSGAKGIFLRVKDTAVLAEIEQAGKLLFYDPILSGNNQRSCASCHKPEAFFTDNGPATPLQFNGQELLPRNTPSLVNAVYQHLAMLDGSHITLQQQTKAVMTNPAEMNGQEEAIMKKVLDCKEYKKTFTHLLQYTPQEPEITMEHLYSAITLYYSKFSRYYAPFDEAMDNGKPLDGLAQQGFNLFMGKAQCGTCHFVPQFSGVKPPFVSSEFEVLGVPADTAYRSLSSDKGRYNVNPAKETLHAFRTGTVRNTAHTGPYMHNGVFRTLNQVIDFYDAGGGAGKGLSVDNQTLSSDSLHLTAREKEALVAFIQSLNEKIIFDTPPVRLPASRNRQLNNRKAGGIY